MGAAVFVAHPVGRVFENSRLREEMSKNTTEVNFPVRRDLTNSRLTGKIVV